MTEDEYRGYIESDLMGIEIQEHTMGDYTDILRNLLKFHVKDGVMVCRAGEDSEMAYFWTGIGFFVVGAYPWKTTEENAGCWITWVEVEDYAFLIPQEFSQLGEPNIMPLAFHNCCVEGFVSALQKLQAYISQKEG